MPIELTSISIDFDNEVTLLGWKNQLRKVIQYKLDPKHDVDAEFFDDKQPSEFDDLIFEIDKQ